MGHRHGIGSDKGDLLEVPSKPLRFRQPWSSLALAGAVAGGAAIVDQVSKAVMVAAVMQPPRLIEITPFLNLTLGFNTGVSFGLFRDTFAEAPYVLSLISAAIVLLVFWWAATARSRWDVVGLGLIAGGAAGNVIDRVRQGAVTDFLDLHAFGWHWPTFNLADVEITFGVVLLLFGSISAGRQQASPSLKPVLGRGDRGSTTR